MTKAKNTPQTKKETLRIDTLFGGIQIPVDEHWDTYSIEEREAIKTLFNFDVTEKKYFTELKKGIRENRINIRDFSVNLPYELAKTLPNATLIMEGDYGGQIYLTCPMKLVQCGMNSLERLLTDLDQIEWGCNEGDGASLEFRRKNPGDGISGGMGGGLVEKGLWVHKSIAQKGLTPLIERVLRGEIQSIKPHLPKDLVID